VLRRKQAVHEVPEELPRNERSRARHRDPTPATIPSAPALLLAGALFAVLF
jgi:hypothetical protein